MLMSKDNRKAIYTYLLEKGVIVAKKDYTSQHPHVKEVPNLHVIKALQSMKSRGYVKEQFAWRHYYWYLTNEGIQYLRDYLHLSSQVLPETLKKTEMAKRSDRPTGDAPFNRMPREGGFMGQRSQYRPVQNVGFGRGSLA